MLITEFTRNPPDDRPRGKQDWKTFCSADEVDALRDLSAQLDAALAAMPDDQKGLEDEVHFQHLWIGMLLGSGLCKSFDRAYAWASFVRYNTTGLTA